MPKRIEYWACIFAVILLGLTASLALAFNPPRGHGAPPVSTQPVARPNVPDASDVAPQPDISVVIPKGTPPLQDIPPKDYLNSLALDTIQKIRQPDKPTFVIKSRYASAQNTVAVSSDGNWLATGGSNGSLHVWRLDTGQRIRALAVGSPALAAEFSVDSKTLISGHEDGRVIVWQTESGDIQKTFNTDGPVYDMAVTANPVTVGTTRGMVIKKKITPQSSRPRGQYLATPDGRGQIALWSLESGEKKRVLQRGNASVSALVASSDDTTLISADETGVIRVWNVENGDHLRELANLGARVFTLALSRDGHFLAAGVGDGSFHVWQMPEGKKIISRKGHDGPVMSLTFAPDGSSLISTGGDHLIKNWSLMDGSFLFERKGHWDVVNDSVFLPSGEHLITASNDRTVRVWPRGDQAESARLVAMKDGWAVVTPEGFFDGTLDGDLEDRLDAIQWVVEKRSLSVDNFMEHYYLPALLGRVLAGKHTGIADNLPRIEDGFPLPPQVRITAPSPDSRMRERAVQVTVEAADQGGGIDEVRLFHNLKIVDSSHADVKRLNQGKENEKILTTYSLSLVDGENILTARGLSRERIESEAVEMAVYYSGEENTTPPVLNLFLVGINSYENPAMNLNFGVPDALGVGNNFGRHAISPEYVRVNKLFDAEATRMGILNGLDGLTGISPQDTLVLYFAGHGNTLKDDWYFIPHDLTEIGSTGSVQKMGISSDMLQEYITRIKAGRIVLLLDACKAGAAVDAFTPFEDHRPIALLTRATGIHVAAASTSEQFANELEILGHGLFTYALLEALSGKADTLPYDSKVTVVETFNFLKEKVPLLTEEYRTMTQKPVISSRGLDFPLTMK